MLGACVITALRDQQQQLSYQQQRQAAKRLTYPRCLPWALPSAPSQAAGRADAQHLEGSSSQRAAHACAHLPPCFYCFTWALSASGGCCGWLTQATCSTEHLSSTRRTNAYASQEEFISNNTFPGADHHLLWCLTHTTQQQRGPSIRMTYSEYV